MAKYALVDGSNIVQNVIAWDGTTPYIPPAGQTPVLIPDNSPVSRGYVQTSPGVFAFGQLPDQIALADKTLKRQNVVNSVATLRQWSDDAETTVVTSGNAVATLQTIVTRLGIFFDRFADLVESQL